MLACGRGRLLAGAALIDEGDIDGLVGGRRGHGRAAALSAIIGIGRRDMQRQEVTEGVQRHVQLGASSALCPIVADPPAATGRGPKSLTVEHRRRSLRSLTVSNARQGAQVLGQLLETTCRQPVLIPLINDEPRHKI